MPKATPPHDRHFSEELKALIPYGYKFKLLAGDAYSKGYIFNAYVDYFFGRKSDSEGVLKMIFKLHLNTLLKEAGFPGRLDSIVTWGVENKYLDQILASKIIKGTIEIGKNYTAVLINSNVDKNAFKRIKCYSSLYCGAGRD